MNRLITAGLGLALVATPLVATSATATAVSSDAAAERRAPAYSVTAKINKSVVTVDEDVVKIRGTVSRRAAGEKVVLQQRLDGRKAWKKSGTSKVRPNGKFLLKDEPSVAGTRFYRVLKPASDGLAKGASKELEVVVYEWATLTNRAYGSHSNVAGVALLASATIATKPYRSSLMPIESGKPTHVEYTLGRLCTSLRTTYALDDSSASGSSGAVKLVLDDVVKVDQPLVVGQVVESATSLVGVFRLRYELTSTASPVSKPAIGTPEVHCTR